MTSLVFHDHHNHSLYSLNDCLIKIPELVKRTKEFGCKSVTITDHGSIGNVQLNENYLYD